jgi:peptidoglycan/LPS O-acetylase OafA/YrhL
MFFHFFNHWVSPLHAPLARILPRGIQYILEHADLGVEVFFVLSGFVIAHSLFGKKITPRYAGGFILRRSLRLDPPYWVVIALSLVLPYLVFPGLSQNLFVRVGGTAGVLGNMFYLPDLLWQPRIVGVAWTLCLEVQFYMAFLCLLAIMHAMKFIVRGRYCWISTVVGGALFAALLIYSVHRWFSSGRNDFGGRWFMFFTGVLMYWTLARRVDRRIFVGYLLAITALSIGFREPRSGAALVAALVIYASAFTGGLRTWLGGKTFQYLGRISYSLYLVHMTAGVATINLLMRLNNDSTAMVFIAFTAAILVSILLADLLNRFVELPAMRLSKSSSVLGKLRLAELWQACANLTGVMGFPPSATTEP